MRRYVFGVVCAACAVGIFVGRAWSQDQARSRADSDVLIEEMQRVVQAGRSRGPLEDTTIVGLRTLGDQRLAPLFAALADAPRWEARVHGVVGLAELDPTHRVNTLVISEIKDPQVRAVVVGEALKLALVEPADVRELAEIADLEPPLRLVLLAKLRKLGGEVTAEEVDAVIAQIPPESVGMRVYGSLVAADIRGEDGVSVWPQIEAISIDAAREAILNVVIKQIREEPLLKVTGFVDKAWAWGRGRTLLELDVIGAMIKQDPARGEAAWGELWAEGPDLSRRLVMSGLLVEFASVVSPDTYAKLSADPDAWIQRMGAFGAAVSKGGPFGDELYDLLAQEYKVSTGAALTALSTIPSERRVEAGKRVMERVLDRENKATVPRYGFEIARLLARDDIASVRVLLDRAVQNKDAPATEMMLASVLEQDPIRLWDQGSAPEMPDRRTRVLAALIEARASLGANLTESQIDDLRRIAAGRELLPPAMRVQAAWLALCAAGQEREALARIMAPDAPSRPVPRSGD